MLIVGCGYLGRRVAERYKGDLPVTGIVQSAASVEKLTEAGIDARQADLDTVWPADLVTEGQSVFYFAPPPSEGKADPRMWNFLSGCNRNGNPKRIVYISTTGVYGDCAGAWVDETRPVNPDADRAFRRLDAENQLLTWADATGGEVVILRVAGIYGPDRLPLARIQRGLPLLRKEEAPFTNRIHVEDLVAVCVAAMDKGRSGEVYLASDGTPSTMVDYFNAVADAAGLPRPPQIDLEEAERELSAGMMSYMRESRRISNRKARDELGVEFRYPDLRSGLAACGL